MANARVRLGLLCLLFFAPVTASRAHGQDPPPIVVSETLHRVRLADGSTLYARVVAVDGDRITLETTSGVKIEVQRVQIRDIRTAHGEVIDGEFWPEDPNSTRLFFTATGRSLRKSQGYIGVYELLFPFVSVGVTDRFTMSGGLPLLLAGELSSFHVAPKYQFVSTPTTALSVGVLGVVAVADEATAFGIAYGVGTFGSRDKALTVGAGWGFADGEVANQPVFLVGGENRVSERVKLLTENYVIFTSDETLMIVSGGLRFMGDRLSADVGAAAGWGEGEGGCCLPLVNFTYGFGRAR